MQLHIMPTVISTELIEFSDILVTNCLRHGSYLTMYEGVRSHVMSEPPQSASARTRKYRPSMLMIQALCISSANQSLSRSGEKRLTRVQSRISR